MNKFEYRTTSGSARATAANPIGPADPKHPEGSGWELVASTADEGVLYWFWKRISPKWEENFLKKTAGLFK